MGGVLAVTIATNGVHFTSYDGNGNVGALAGATSGTVTANYDYSPFGVQLRAEGVVAKANPIRWSTQFADDVTGTTKYLFRDYQAGTGRWWNRDLIEERGGLHLMAFVLNRPTMLHDSLGLSFDWATPSFTTVPRAIPDPDDPENKIGGATDWSEFGPSVTVWTHPSVCQCPLYTLSVFGRAGVFYWWVKGVERYRLHELDHVNLHFFPAYAAFKENAESYQGMCMSKKRADCLKGVIEGEMRAAYRQQAYATGSEYDCNDYGRGSPASEACQRRDYEVAKYLDMLAKLSDALQKCEE